MDSVFAPIREGAARAAARRHEEALQIVTRAIYQALAACDLAAKIASLQHHTAPKLEGGAIVQVRGESVYQSQRRILLEAVEKGLRRSSGTPGASRDTMDIS